MENNNFKRYLLAPVLVRLTGNWYGISKAVKASDAIATRRRSRLTCQWSRGTLASLQKRFAPGWSISRWSRK